MNGHHLRWRVPVLIGLAFLLLGYNLWSYCCGNCTLRTFMTLGPFGWSLSALVLAAGLLLFILRRRRKGRQCRCGNLRAAGWVFCPFCGENFSGKPF